MAVMGIFRQCLSSVLSEYNAVSTLVFYGCDPQLKQLKKSFICPRTISISRVLASTLAHAMWGVMSNLRLS